MHPLQWVQHNELLAGVPYELTGLCPTSAHLMPFLRRLDEQHFQPVVRYTRAIDRLVGANDALVARESDGYVRYRITINCNICNHHSLIVVQNMLH